MDDLFRFAGLLVFGALGILHMEATFGLARDRRKRIKSDEPDPAKSK
jgi:hypothetical protein